MLSLEATINKLSESYSETLRARNRNFEERIKTFFTSESQKCLVLETKDATHGIVRIHKILQTLAASLLELSLLKWKQLMGLMDAQKVLPKLGNCLLLEFGNDEPEYKNLNILNDLIERVNMVPQKKVVLIFNHQACLDTYLNYIGIEAFLKINEFTDQISSLSDNTINEMLYRAALAGRIKHVELLLQKNPNINKAGDNKGNTALHGAAEFGDKHLTLILLQHGALICENQFGDTPLHVASEAGHTKAVATLLSFTIEVNSKNTEGRTALHLAADLKHYEIVEMLINYGADVNCKDKDGFTPLHYAVCANDCGIVKLLVIKGACVQTKNNWNESSVDIARQHAYNEIEELLMLKGQVSRRSVNLEMLWKSTATIDYIE